MKAIQLPWVWFIYSRKSLWPLNFPKKYIYWKENGFTNYQKEYSGLFHSYILLCVDKIIHSTMSRHYTKHWISNDNQIPSLPLRSSQPGEVNKHVNKQLWNDVTNANLVKKNYRSVGEGHWLPDSPGRENVIRDPAWVKALQLRVNQMERWEKDMRGWGKEQREGTWIDSIHSINIDWVPTMCAKHWDRAEHRRQSGWEAWEDRAYHSNEAEGTDGIDQTWMCLPC